jgi:8-oxo-dGTP diphosphatase
MGKIVGPDKIGWVRIADRRLLVSRNRNATRFYLPGGGREDGETDVQTLVREASEELGIRLDPSTARHIGTYLARRDNSPDDLIFIAYSAEHAGELTPSMEVVDLAWVTSADGDLVTDAERQLMATLVKRALID